MPNPPLVSDLRDIYTYRPFSLLNGIRILSAIFWTIFRDFLSEIESDHKNFLEVKQDPQAGP